MKLDDYLERIGYTGPAGNDAATLFGVQRAHVLSVPFENLDVQFGVPLTTDVQAAYDKIVTRRRGGWCYEQNGVFGWALEALGFDVTRVAAAVMRQVRGDSSLANHLCLLVRSPAFPATYLADVGFGGSLLEPLVLAAGEIRQEPYRVGLAQIDDAWWRFSETASTDSFGFDFRAEPGDELAMSAKCSRLQTDADSPFVQNAVVQRRGMDRHLALRGRVLTTTGGALPGRRLVRTPDEYIEILAREFSLDVPDVADLWPAIVERHERLGLGGA